MPRNYKHIPNKFNQEQIDVIESYWKIDCDWITSNIEAVDRSKICPTHGFRHKRTPDDMTYRKLYEMFPEFPMQAWADVFSVGRESIRQQHERVFGSNYGDDRQEAVNGIAPDMEKIDAYIESLATKPTLSPETILTFLGIAPSYIVYWQNKVPEIKEAITKAKVDREHLKKNPKELKCYRCGITKDVKSFHNSTKTVHGYTTTCKECSIATVKYYYGKRKREFSPDKIASEKKCTVCKEVRHRKWFHLSKGQSGGLQSTCITCQDKQEKKSPERKRKFKEAGLDSNQICKGCKKDKDCLEYFLIVPDRFRHPENKWKTTYCRTCIRDAAKLFGLSGPKFTSSYRSKSGDYGRTNPYEFAKIMAEGKLPKYVGGNIVKEDKGKVYSWQSFINEYGEEEE